MVPSDHTNQAFETDVLEQLFAMGDASLKVALSTQLLADFTRLKDAISVDDGRAVARAAHELKGLAATVGAHRLADMAKSLDATAEMLPAAARAAIVAPILGEIDTVLAYLRQASENAPDA